MSLLAPCGQKAAHIVASTSRIPLTKPFTPRTLKNLRDALNIPEAYGGYQHPKNAAVLIPFCNVNNEPSVLFELRSKSLRSHSGEVRYQNPFQPCNQPINIMGQLSWRAGR